MGGFGERYWWRDGVNEQLRASLGLARVTVQKMLRYAVPPGYQRQQAVKRPKLGPWVGVIDAILEEDKQHAAEAAAHGQADLRAVARGARVHGRLHHREGLRSHGEAAVARDVRSLDARAGRGAGGLRRGAGGDGRGEAEGALPGHGSSALG